MDQTSLYKYPVLTKLKNGVGKLLLALISTLVTLLILEGVVRIFIPQQLILIRPDIWIPAETIGWRMASNLDTLVNTGERTVRLITDDAGYRIGIEKPQVGSYKILALGDSFLAAIQVPYEQTMTGQLEWMLSRELNEPVTIVNTGVGGWEPNHYLLKLTEELSVQDYDLALVFLYSANDIVEKRIDAYPPKQGEVRHFFRWPASMAREELVDALAYPINDFLETRSQLYTLVKDKGRFLLMRAGLSAYYFADSLSSTQANSPRWRITTEICAEIATEGAKHGIPVVFVLLPADYQVNPAFVDQYVQALGIDPALVDLDQPSRILGKLFSERDLILLDMLPVLHAAFIEGKPDLYGKVDTHLGINGHKVVAEALLPEILPFLKP